MEEDLISIIIPVYNSEKYISRCLDSVIGQTYHNLQIITINDGSTDGTRKILNQYAEKDSRILIIDQENLGVSQARNNGIEKAKGKYLCFVDSDDYIKESMVEKLYRNLNQSRLVVCGFIDDYDERKICGLKPFDGGIKCRNEYLETMSQYLYSVYFGAVCNKLYVAYIVKNNKITFRKGISWAEDLIFNLEYLEYVDRITIICDELYFYYQEVKNSLTKNRDIMYLWNMALIRYTFCKEQYKKMNMYDTCKVNIDTAIAIELIGPTYYICKENYKGYRYAKKSLKELYSQKIVIDAIKNNKKPQMVHRIAKVAFYFKSYGLFVFMMRIWVPIQNIIKEIKNRGEYDTNGKN